MKDEPPNDAESKELAVEVWKKVVQTQEHFNEICIRFVLCTRR